MALKNPLSLLGVLLLVASFSLAAGISPGWAQSSTPTVEPTPSGMIPITEMMVPPPLPENPTQVDLGRQTYYYVCMACHGDLGQGLTPEWIEQWGLERNTCWQSKCHASNHPPEGFTLPRTIPGVVGPVLTNRFASALELFQYISTAMPWHAPGTLKEDEYWQLTAFLLQLNGIGPLPPVLDVASAARLAWGASTPVSAQPSTQPTREVITPSPPPGTRVPFHNSGAVWVGAGVVLAVFVFALGDALWAVRQK